jgi:hypothetical protein
MNMYEDGINPDLCAACINSSKVERPMTAAVALASGQPRMNSEDSEILLTEGIL